MSVVVPVNMSVVAPVNMSVVAPVSMSVVAPVNMKFCYISDGGRQAYSGPCRKP